MKTFWIFARRGIKPLQPGYGLKLPAVTLLLAMQALPVAAQETATNETDTGQNWMTAAGAASQPPRWSLEIRTGELEPELEEWAQFYGDDHADQLGFALAYKVLPYVDVGLAVDHVHDKGVGNLPLNGMPGGEVEFHLYPAHLYVMLRGAFFENQWIVPYAGGGITRAYYRQAIDNQPSVRGKTDGDHSRAGLQILLDWLDEGNAAGFEEESVENTYLFVERLSFSVEVDGIELGGDSVVFGLAFEF